MELNAAVKSKRACVIIEKEMRFKFGRVLHLLDSETVLNMINKTSTRFKTYEGVRIGEIQAASNGNMSNWAWISGNNNIADWLTRGRTPKQLGADTEWWNGRALLTKPIEEWNLKFGSQREVILHGERKVCLATTSINHKFLDYNRYSSIDRLIWVVARIHNSLKMKSFAG
ncbi:hypothetical protein SNE40_002753 [Patella caerulea]|uniref:Uncharacterized protein n=1 Tax=Patella caerulea TaxID=87958 RepID=A0AAN8K1P2_PATCE